VAPELHVADPYMSSVGEKTKKISDYLYFQSANSPTKPHLLTKQNNLCPMWEAGLRGAAVGWGTALQTGRSRVRFTTVSLGFFVDITLPTALWPWRRLNFWHKWVPGVCPGGKGGQCLGLTTSPPSCADCLEIWESQPPGTLRSCPALYRDCFAPIKSYVFRLKKVIIRMFV
jgi:hypothetical protein